MFCPDHNQAKLAGRSRLVGPRAVLRQRPDNSRPNLFGGD